MNPLRTSSINFKAILLGAVFLLALPAAVFAQGSPENEDIIIGRFNGEVENNGIPKGWKLFKFPKKPQTEYSVQKNGEDFYYLKGQSSSAASSVYREVNFDLKEYPGLSWNWKVDGILQKGDEMKKEGDDYAARIYVTFEYEPDKASLFEKIKYELLEKIYGIKPPGNAINYIWANKLKKGEAVPNPFTDKVIMVAVESGAENAGKWVPEERNVYEDYKKYFKSEPPRIVAVALMTDTDNTKESATGYYADIIFKKRP